MEATVTATDAGIEVNVEEYDGTYKCLFCGESCERRDCGAELGH